MWCDCVHYNSTQMQCVHPVHMRGRREEGRKEKEGSCSGTYQLIKWSRWVFANYRATSFSFFLIVNNSEIHAHNSAIICYVCACNRSRGLPLAHAQSKIKMRVIRSSSYLLYRRTLRGKRVYQLSKRCGAASVRVWSISIIYFRMHSARCIYTELPFFSARACSAFWWAGTGAFKVQKLIAHIIWRKCCSSLTGDSATIPKHGVVLEKFGVAWGGTPSLHELGNEERDAAGSRDHQRLPDEINSQKETAIWRERT